MVKSGNSLGYFILGLGVSLLIISLSFFVLKDMFNFLLFKTNNFILSIILIVIYLIIPFLLNFLAYKTFVNLPAFKWKRKTKSTKRNVFIYTCQVCKKAHQSKKSLRASKVLLE